MHRLIRFLCVFLSLCLLAAAGVTVAATVRLERYARAAEESPPVIPDLRGIGEPSVLYAYDPEDRAAARGDPGGPRLWGNLVCVLAQRRRKGK